MHALPVTFRPARWAAFALAAALLLALAPAVRAQTGGADDLQSGFDAPLPGAAPPADDGGGQGAGSSDPFQGGFSDVTPGSPPGAPEAEAAPWWELTGFLRLDGAYAYAQEEEPFQGLTKLRTSVRLELSLDLARHWRAFASGQAFRDWAYQLRGEERYPQAVLERNQQEGELLEAWVLGTPWPSLDVKIGRQIVVWGKSDTIRITDVLNPIDLREPGLTDLEDLRLPLAMAKVSWYVGPWSLTGIAIPEIRFNKEPAFGSDYFPLPMPPPPEVMPADGGSNTEWAASLSGVFSGWDLAFYAAHLFSDEFYVDAATLTRQHARVRMAGAAVNVALGNWLLKTEWAHFRDLQFGLPSGQTFSRLDGMIGAEYAGFTDTTLAFEAADRRLLDYDPLLAALPLPQAEDVNQYVLSYRGSYLREKLDVVAVLIAYGAKAEQGTTQRYQLTYEVVQALDLTGGVIVYTPGDGGNYLLAGAQDNDRLFAELKWSF
jgi:hypothetical protein